MKIRLSTTILLLLMMTIGNLCFAQKDTLIIYQDYETSLYGYQDSYYDIVIFPQYDYAGDFSEGYAVVQSGAQNMLIDMSGKKFLALDFGTTQTVTHGLLTGEKDEKYGCIDLKGNVVIPFEYSYLSVIGDGLLMYGEKGKFGLMNRNGKKITEAKYEDIDNYSDGLIRVLDDNKYGFINTSGTLIIPCKYEYTQSFHQGVCPVMDHSELWGLIDRNDQFILKPMYDGMSEFTEGRAAASLDLKSGFIDLSGKQITDIVYDNYTLFQNGLASVNAGDNWGVIDLNGKEILPVEYYEIEYPEKKTILASNLVEESTFYTLFDNTGKPLTDFDLDDVFHLGNSLYRVTKGDLTSMIDQTGKEILPLEYTSLGSFYQQVTIAGKGEQFGLINTKGETIVDFGKYDTFDYFIRGLVRVSKNDLYGYLDLNGNEVIPVTYPVLGYLIGSITYFERDGKYGLIGRDGKEKDWIYDEIYDFAFGLALVSMDNKYGFIDYTGAQVIPLEYDYAEQFAAPQTWCTRDGKSGTIDVKNNTVVPFIYDSYSLLYITTYEFYTDSPIGYQVVSNGKTGVIQMDGTVTIPVIYDFIGEFNEQKTAWARLNGKLGGIGIDNTIVLPFKFDEIGIFRDGYAKASVDGAWGIIDKYGNIVITPKYSFVNSLVEEMAAVQMNNQWGFCHISGREVVAPKYQAVENFKEGYAAVQLNNKWGFIDKDGVVVVQPIYDTVTDFNGGFSIAVSGKKKYSIEAGMFTRTRLKQ